MPFALDSKTMHLAIDMQRLFAEKTDWFIPWLPRVLPQVAALARHAPERTLCSRFIPPSSPKEVTGAWRDYYQHWAAMTRKQLDRALLDLVEPLAAICPPGRRINKTVYSEFVNKHLAPALRRRGIETLIFSGGETDVCVLATVMAAVDLGFRVILPVDALCSGRDATHDALLRLYTDRFTNQIETTSTARILRTGSLGLMSPKPTSSGNPAYPSA